MHCSTTVVGRPATKSRRKLASAVVALGAFLLVTLLSQPASASQVSSVTVGISPTTAGVTSTYTVTFTTTAGLAANSGTITFYASGGQAGTVFPATASSYVITDLTRAAGSGTVSATPVRTNANAQVSFAVPKKVNAGDRLRVTVSGVTNPPMSSTNQTLSVWTSGDTTPVASPTYVVTPSPDGSGTMTVSPTSTPAGAPATLTFTYTATTGGTSNGKLSVTVPTGWTAPSATAGQPGYTTASTGAVSVSNRTITVAGVSLPSGGTATVVYGSGGGSQAATSSTTIGSHAFAVAEQSTATGVMTPLSGSQPTVTTTASSDGAGTVTASPASVPGGSPTTVTFTYTAASGGMAGGQLDLVVPAAWTAPSAVAGTAGYVTASAGVVSVSGRTVSVGGLTLATASTVTLSYGSGGGANSAVSPQAFGTSAFTGATKSTAAGTLVALAAPATVAVQQPTLAIAPGAVTTVAGNGTSATVNGTGAGASFTEMGGVVRSGGSVYVATLGSVRRVDTATGQTSILSGDASSTGCVNGSPAASRFGQLAGMATDGTFLYVADMSCGIRKLSIATGDSSTLSTMRPTVLAMGPDGSLYAGGSDGGSFYGRWGYGSLYRVNPTTGAAQSFGGLNSVQAIAADETYVWAMQASACYNPCHTELVRVAMDGTATSIRGAAPITSGGALASAGDYLYAGSYGSYQTEVRRYRKTDATWTSVAGTNSGGFADGTGTDAWFGALTGFSSDGQNLWIADGGNRRLRKAVAAPPLSAQQQASASTTLALAPGAVTTLAGNGLDGSAEGVGSSASFREMGGVVRVGNVVYVGTNGAVRRIDEATGAASTLAGHTTETNCVDSTSGTGARFGQIAGVTTDGYYVYVADMGCGIRRVSLANGATSTVNSMRPTVLTFGPDGNLYAGGSDGGATYGRWGYGALYRVNPSTGVAVSFGGLGSVQAVASDGTYVWATNATACYNPCQTELVRVAMDGAATVIRGYAAISSGGVLASAGDYLYAGSYGYSQTEIRRYRKSDATWTSVAGTTSGGFADGTGTDAWFTALTGLSSDGQNLWVADGGNRRVRRVVVTPALAAQQQPSASTTVALSPGVVTTVAGSGADATADGSAGSASFTNTGGAVAAGAFTYVGTNGSVRRVDRATGEVTTLAGHPTDRSCVNSTSGTGARFGQVAGVTTDGYYLYVADMSCGIRRVSLATGATSTVNTMGSTVLTFGPDGNLYAGGSDGGSFYGRWGYGALYRVNPSTGVAVSFGGLGSVQAVASDGTYVWATNATACYNPCQTELVRVAMDGTATTVRGYAPITSGGVLVSAGDYLYAGSYGYYQTEIRRYRKSDATWVSVAGSSTSGLADGTGTQAAFSAITGLATDGEWIWVADGGNRRMRVVADRALPPVTGENFGFEGYGMPSGEDVNGAVGNFVTAATDVSVASIGPSLEMSRTYNSLDARRGPLGAGWTFNYDMRSERVAYGSVAITYPDGRREIHKALGNGNYLAPTGYFSKLYDAPSTGGTTLVTKDGTTFGFAANGRLTSITDENARQVVLTYDIDGNLATASSASGRTLQFTWGAGRITSVSTDAVAAHGGPLTWRYYYNGEFLERVCDPRNNAVTGSCTVYAYASAARLTKTWNPKGNVEVEVAYQADGKVDWRKNGAGDITDVSYPAPRVAHFVDGRTNRTIREYDGFGRLAKETDALDNATSYEYDPAGNRSRVVDANNNSSSMTYDTRGNLTSVTNGEGKTRYQSYDAKDNKITSLDERSSGPNDATYATRYDYDPAGNPITETSPATPEFPSGVATQWTYTNGTEAAVGGGSMPRGLVRTETDERNKVTTKSYDGRGDLREVIDPVGLRTTYAYDELGRKTSETVYSDAFPAGVTTTSTYTKLSQPEQVTGPLVPGAGGPAHQRRSTKLYDANGNVETVYDIDLTGSDVARTTTYTYDDADREKTATDPEGGVLSRDFDAAGNVTQVTDPEGRITVTTYDARNLSIKLTLKDFVDDPIASSTPRDVVLREVGYDNGRRKTSEKDGLGRVTAYDYDRADRPTKTTRIGYVDRDGTVRDVVLSELVYDPAGRVTRETTGNGTRRVDTAFDAIGRRTSSTVDPAGLARTTTWTYDAAGNITSQTLSDATRTEQTRSTYDDGGRTLSSTVEIGAVDLVTTYGYDQRDNMTSVVEPRGNVAGGDPAAYRTTNVYDELSRRIRTTAPTVTIEQSGQSTTGQPTSETRYDTFGATTRSVDPRGAVTTRALDRLGRDKVVTYPAYLTPAGATITPTESFDYDRVGNLVSKVDRRGQRTDFTFDKRNRVVRQLDPLVTGEAARGDTRYAYDDQGNATSTVDPIGARTEWTYDALDRKRTETAVVRRIGGTDRYTTTFDYDDRGNATYLRSPAGEVTAQSWSVANEVRTVTDATSKTTTHDYDIAGRRVRTTDPLGRSSSVSFDPAGRATTASRHAPGGATLTTTGFGFDVAGNRTSVTSPRGFTSTSTYDALGRLSSVTQPIDATRATTTSYDYDAAGNRTRITDGRGNVTTKTYNSWNAIEDTVEPSTAAHPTLTDRRWRTSYDAAGLPVGDEEPGGVVVTRSFDELGRPLSEAGTGGGAAVATVSLGWDLSGRQKSANHPSGTIAFAYDDRGLLTASTSPSGNASFTYDADGRMLSRSDAAGVTSFTWTDRSELRTASDPLTGTTRTYTWDPAGQLDSVSYGTGAGARDYSFDDLGRLTEDKLTKADGTMTEREVYGYDADDNLTSQLVELAGNAGAGANTYGYDRAGRLVSWTKPDTSEVSYGWDDSGNRTSAGANTFTYDERNRMTSGPDGTYSWSPRGTLASVAGSAGTTTYGFDALGRLVNFNGTTSYAYDGLDRIASSDGAAFAYSGAALDPAGDGGSLYSRSPDGDLLALSSGANTGIVGRNRHGDVTHLFAASGVVSSTRTFDPFGDVLASTGYTPGVGFQGDWTDPASGKVWMGARWYDAQDAAFASRDSVFGDPNSGASLNRYTYAFADPLDYFDADGHWPKFVNDLARGAKRAVKATAKIVTAAPRAVMKASTAVADTIVVQVQKGQHKLSEARAAVTAKVRGAVAAARAAPGAIRRKVADAKVGGLRVGDWAGGASDEFSARWQSAKDRGARAMDAYYERGGGLAGAVDLFNIGFNPMYGTLERAGAAHDEAGGGVDGWLAAGNQFNPAYATLVAGDAAITECRKGVSLTCAQHAAEATAAATSTVLTATGAASAVSTLGSAGAPAATPGLATSAPRATGNAYSVAFETQLDEAVLGSSRSVHFNRANAALDDALRSDSAFASQFDEMIPGASGAVSRTGGRATPGGYTWHHAPSSAAGGSTGVMQLVPTWQHASGSIWQRLLHPGGSGGYSEWAIPRGAPR